MTAGFLLLNLIQAPLASWSEEPGERDAVKLGKITEIFHKEAYQEYAPGMDDAGSQELRHELQQRGLDASFLEAGQPLCNQLSEADRHYPQLCSDGILLGACVRGMAQSLSDPYAAYLSPVAFSGLMGRFGGKDSGGPGVAVIKDHPGDPAQVLESNESSPAAEAHLMPGDLVLEIDGSPTTSLAIDDTRGRLQGPVGTTVDLTVKRGKAAPEHIVLKRIKLDGHTVEAHKITYHSQEWGYVRIRSFGSQTAEELKKALLQFKGAAGLVLDLRNNGGGLVLSAVSVCSNFLPEGAAVVSVNGRSHSEFHKALEGPRASLPLVILINENSASSAEITASALHDSGVGVLVGTKSFGKGTVQRYLPLGDGSALKLTTAHYRTARGAEIHGKGIIPDVVINDAGLGQVADLQLQRALEVLVAQQEGSTSFPAQYQRPHPSVQQTLRNGPSLSLH